MKKSKVTVLSIIITLSIACMGFVGPHGAWRTYVPSEPPQPSNLEPITILLILSLVLAIAIIISYAVGYHSGHRDSLKEPKQEKKGEI